MSDKKQPNFENSLTELSSLVEAMEKGDLPLEDALKHFEKGINLIRQCQKSLSAAEQKVQILLQEKDNDTLNEFKTED